MKLQTTCLALCKGEKRLAMGVVYRAVRDLHNYLTNAGCAEGNITNREVRRVIRWINSNSTEDNSFLFWVDAATDSVDHKYELIEKIRNYSQRAKKYID